MTKVTFSLTYKKFDIPLVSIMVHQIARYFSKYKQNNNFEILGMKMGPRLTSPKGRSQLNHHFPQSGPPFQIRKLVFSESSKLLGSWTCIEPNSQETGI